MADNIDAQGYSRTYAAVYRDAKEGEFGFEYGAKTPMSGFKVMHIDAQPIAKMTGAPVETGFMFNDNKVIEPIIVAVTGNVKAADFKKVYGEVKKMFLNRKFEFYCVSSKTEFFKNLCLIEMPHKEEPDKYDVIEMTLKFQQVQMDDEQSQPDDESNQDTQSVGLVAGA